MASVFYLDQWSKHLIQLKFYWGESLPIWRDFFAITYVRNAGAAFGFLNQAPSRIRDPFFLVVSVTALLILSGLVWRQNRGPQLRLAALSLVFGGALGNLWDRLHLGYVVDFLDFHWKNVYHWPAFNVADSSIVVGISLIVCLTIFETPVKQEG